MKNWISIDLVTTGFDEELDEIISISAVKYNAFLEEDTFYRLLKTNRFIDYSDYISFDKQQKKYSFNDVYNDLIRFIGDLTIISHKAYLDDCFLWMACKENHLPVLRNSWIDTQEIFLETYRHQSGLGNVIDKFNIQGCQKYDYFSNARKVGSLYRRLAN